MAENEWVTGKIGLRAHGVPLEFELTVPAFPVKPHRILPIFQQMANSFVDVGVEEAKKEGRTVSCKAGCGACCRQPVPISETEVYQIAELVEAMDEPRRTEIKERFAAAVEHFDTINWYERFNEHRRLAPEKEPDEAVREGIDIVMEYFRQGIPCPFLENESCSIHQNRPVVCREYLVTNPAENCSNPSPTTIRLVDLLIKPSKALRRVGSKGKIDRFGTPFLSRALMIAAAEPEDFDEKPGPEWVKEFIEELTHSQVPDEPHSQVPNNNGASGNPPDVG